MTKVENTRIGDSSRSEDILYGPMLSEKYAIDFLKGLEMCDGDGAKRIFGNGRITSDNAPLQYVDWFQRYVGTPV